MLNTWLALTELTEATSTWIILCKVRPWEMILWGMQTNITHFRRSALVCGVMTNLKWSLFWSIASLNVPLEKEEDEDAASRTENEWVRKSASVSHFRADGIMRSGQEPQTCGSVFSIVVQTQRDNWQHSSLSIWDAPPANVPPVCPSTPQHIHTKPISVNVAQGLLACHQCTTTGMAFHSGISHSQPYCPLPLYTRNSARSGQVRPSHSWGTWQSAVL